MCLTVVFFQLAVEHGCGGVDSVAKAVWMVDAIDQWFKENGKHFSESSNFPSATHFHSSFNVMYCVPFPLLVVIQTAV